VSTAFACPYDGPVDPQAVLRVVEPLVEMGCHEINLGDTTGSGTPASVGRLLEVISPVVPLDRITLHFHDTWGMGIANVCAGLDHGVRSFDASAGGLGGCPYAPGASGNIGTEDLVHLLHARGFETGIDLPSLARAAAELGQHLDHALPGRAHQALMAKEPSACS